MAAVTINIFSIIVYHIE